MMFPILGWLQILPGDNPPCFLCCIQVLLQCSGIKFSEIPQCGGLYNIDTLLRALFDPALLIYLGFSFVPGLCNYVPFFINMWMIPPPLMTEEEKMMRKAPSLKKLIDSAKNDPEMTKFDTPCNTENKTKVQESQPFAEGISNDIINQIKNESKILDFVILKTYFFR